MTELPTPLQRTQAIPLALTRPTWFDYSRLTIRPGVTLHASGGHLGKVFDALAPRAPQPETRPTHFLVIDDAVYRAHLMQALADEGHVIENMTPFPVDWRPLMRQALLTLAIVAGISWLSCGGRMLARVRGSPYWLDHFNNPPNASITVGISLSRRASHKVSPQLIRSTAMKLDRYFRSFTWWVDPLGIALAYLWSSLNDDAPEFVFCGGCMALEALTNTGASEITHQLAERCAVLTGNTRARRQETYALARKLYSLRSNLVHGRVELKKGRVRRDKLYATAKGINVPIAEFSALLNLVCDTIQGVLNSTELLRILHTNANDRTTLERMEAFYRNAVLR